MMYDSTSMTSTISSASIEDRSSRWTTFRQRNRNRPLKQIRVGGSVVLVVCVYFYILLFFQPQYDVHPILKLNTQRHESFLQRQEELQQRIQTMREKRLNITRIRNQEWQEQQRRRRKATAADESSIVHKQQNATAANNTFIESSEEDEVSEWVIFLRFLSSFLMMTSICAMTRILVVYYIRPNLVVLSTTNNNINNRRQRRGGASANSRDARQAAFRAWAARLNAQRAAQGERPLSLDSLRVVLRNRDLTGNDYEELLRFDEEAGPAMSLLQSMGATQDEIERCPRRTLVEGDDLLRVPGLGDNRPPPHCAVCLEQYQVNEQVRTIPCFHTFHVHCIDNWLERKAACPICKHPAVG